MRIIWNDIRYGLRMLAANPGFTLVVVISLAIAIGANTSMFSLVDALLLHPPPVPDPSAIVHVASTSPSLRLGSLSYPDYLDFHDRAKTVSGLLACRHVVLGFRSDTKTATRLKLALAVSPNFFDVLQVRPSLGRGFAAQEERSHVAILSDRLWESAFARDPAVIGRTVGLSKVDFTIIGVAPSSFSGLNHMVHEEFYVPSGVLPELGPTISSDSRDRLRWDVLGRLAPGQNTRQAQAEFQAIAHSLEEAYPDTNRGRSVLVMPETRFLIANEPEDATQEWILLAIAGTVLLIACANIASLLLSRGRARSREIAIRLAIGAGRRRLFQQLLTESLLLAMLGGAAGLILALFSIDFFSSLRLPTSLPLYIVARPDLRVLMFTLAVTLLSGVVFGVAPALHALQSDVNSTLKGGESPQSRKRRLFHGRNALVVTQIGISMMLLVASGLLLKDFSRLSPSRAGFRVDHVLLMGLDPSLVRYSESQGRAFFQAALQRARALPGVRSAALGENLPLGVTSSSRDIVVDGFEMASGQRAITVSSDIVSDHYFALMRIPLVKGRPFDQTDSAVSGPVAIVNEAMAEKYWPRRSALGGRIRLNGKVLEVVGIAKTIKYRDIGEKPMPFLYLPFSQNYTSFLALHVQTEGDPAASASHVVAEIRALDPAMPVQDVQTMEHFFESALFGYRLTMQLTTIIGLFGMVLAITGLYSVIAYSVSRRTREIGIRLAIGADSQKIAGLVLRQGLRLTIFGTATGLALAFAASKLLGSLLAGLSPRDPLVYSLVTLVLIGVSLLACYVPARRAARVDPVEALRHD